MQAPLANPFAAGAKPAAASPAAPNPFASLDNDAWSKAAEKTSTPPQAAPLAEAPVAPAPAPAVSPWDSMGKAAAAVRPRLNDQRNAAEARLTLLVRAAGAGAAGDGIASAVCSSDGFQPERSPTAGRSRAEPVGPGGDDCRSAAAGELTCVPLYGRRRRFSALTCVLLRCR